MDSPQIFIDVQPATKVRFRYSSETASLLQGENGSIKVSIRNIQSRVLLQVSCVGVDRPYYPHPHKLMGDNCKDGIFSVDLPRPTHPADMLNYTFNKLSIECPRKKDIAESIEDRKRRKVDPFETSFSESKSLQLDRIRLAFQVLLRNDGIWLQPVVSNVVFDEKKNKDIQIIDINPTAVTFDGGLLWILAKNNLPGDPKKIKVIFTFGEKCEKTVEPEKIHHKVLVIVAAPLLEQQFRNEEKRIQVMVALDCNGEPSRQSPITYYESVCICDLNGGAALSKRKRATKTSDFTNCSPLTTPFLKSTVFDNNQQIGPSSAVELREELCYDPNFPGSIANQQIFPSSAVELLEELCYDPNFPGSIANQQICPSSAAELREELCYDPNFPGSIANQQICHSSADKYSNESYLPINITNLSPTTQDLSFGDYFLEQMGLKLGDSLDSQTDIANIVFENSRTQNLFVYDIYENQTDF